MRNTDGFVCGLIREALESGEEIEKHALCQKIGNLAKHVHGKRNAPQYLHMQDALRLLVDSGEIVERYARSQFDSEQRKLGYTYYRMAREA